VRVAPGGSVWPVNPPGTSGVVVGLLTALARGDALVADMGLEGRRDVGGMGLMSSDSGWWASRDDKRLARGLVTLPGDSCDGFCAVGGNGRLLPFSAGGGELGRTGAPGRAVV